MPRDYTNVPLGELNWSSLKVGDRVRLPDGRLATVRKEYWYDETKALPQQLEVEPDAEGK
jgi:hypothetical protein